MKPSFLKTIHPLYLIAFLFVFAINFWRVPFGFPSIDESLYLSIPYRILQGDVFLLEEWHVTQMAGFFLLPLLRLFLLIKGNTDGVYLAFRYLYLFFHTLVSLYIYVRMQKRDRTAAAVASVYYEISTYGGLMALSYNTMAIGFMVLAGVTLATSEGKNSDYLASGLFYASSVLCCPFLLLVYIVYCLAVFVFLLLKKKDPDLGQVLSIRCWALFTLSCIALAVVFFLRIFLFSEGGIPKLIASLPLIFSDKSHPMRTPMEWLKGFYGTFNRFNRFFKPILFGSILLSAFIFLDKRRSAHRQYYLMFAVGLTILFASPYLLMYLNPNLIVFPVNIIGFFAYLLCEKRDRRMMAFLYIPAAVFWACIDMASNMGMSSIAAMSVTGTPACFAFIVQLVREMLPTEGNARFSRIINRLSAGLCVLCAAVLLGALTYSRIEYTFAGPAPWDSPEIVTQGSMKGMHTTRDVLDLYNREYAAFRPLREIPEGNVLYFFEASYRYLEDPKRCSSYSMWFSPSDPFDSVRLLREYWKLNPYKFPDYICINDEYLSDPRVFEALSEYSYTSVPLESGMLLIMEKPA